MEGTRVECIIGATRIRDFSTATEALALRAIVQILSVSRFQVLQAKVMTFVNQIAEVSFREHLSCVPKLKLPDCPWRR